MPDVTKSMVIQVSQTGAEKTAASLGMLDKAQARVAITGSSANMVLLNTSRVIQDMPYGLIAVSNNVDMVVQQFIMLRTTTGSTSAALLAMKASLLGTGGIMFAISAVTALSVLWAQSKREVVKESDKTQKALEKEREVLDKYTDAVDRLNSRSKGGTESGRRAATDDERKLAQARLRATEDYIKAQTTGTDIIVDDVGRTRAEVGAYTDQLERLRGKSIETAKQIADDWRAAVQAAQSAMQEIKIIANQAKTFDPFTGRSAKTRSSTVGQARTLKD